MGRVPLFFFGLFILALTILPEAMSWSGILPDRAREIILLALEASHRTSSITLVTFSR